MKLLAIWTLVCSICVVRSQNNDLWDTYNQCRPKLGQDSWLCDPSGKIQSKDIRDRLDTLLWRLQTDVPCYCHDSGDCFRYRNVSIQSGVVGALIVTNNLPSDIKDTAKRIYDDANLAASKSCDNGLLFVYASDGQQLYVLRGATTQQTMFTSAESDTVSNISPDYLVGTVEQYVLGLQGKTYERQRNWEAIVGIVVGTAIVAFVAAVIGGVCCTRYCAKKKSLSSPPPSAYVLKQQEKMKSALRRVKRRQTRAVIRNKNRSDKSKTITGRPMSPKRLASAKRRLLRKQNKKQRQQKNQQQQQALLTPSSASEEQYYLISEPGSTLYQPYGAQTTLRMGHESPYGTGTLRPSSATGYPPAILYPDSQAVFNRPPSPKRETQRRDFYVYDEEGKEIYDAPAR